jgi:hypothetical protein
LGTFGSKKAQQGAKIAQICRLGPFELILGTFRYFNEFKLFFAELVDFFYLIGEFLKG